MVRGDDEDVGVNQRGPETPNPRGRSIPAVDVDASNLRFGFVRLRHGNSQDTLGEGSRYLVLLDVFERDAPFEAAVVSFADSAVLVLGLRLLFAGDRQHSVGKFEANVFFVQAGQFGRDPDVL